MSRRNDINSILIIGSGPIVIGQACEFDYSGTQACRVLKQEGYRVVLINSNPATIMTDPELADATYIEPITPYFVEKILQKEKPDAILPTMGGQTALNVAVELAEKGILDNYNCKLIGANLNAIKTAEDRELFRKAIDEIGLEMPKGFFVHTFDEGIKAAEKIGFPIILRAAFTLGGTGGGIAYNIDEFKALLESGLKISPISEVLVEESVIGWKEFELEVMRDSVDNFVVVCSIENFDPMGIHTGDSITVAPAQTLTDKEYQQLREAAKKIIRKIGVETGGSNIQFAINPETGRQVVIEMNPRVSRSSALASKATGFPIAKIAAKLAVGYTLDEVPNDITKKTPACFEPTLDYCVVKIPRWDFEKFKGINDSLGVQMKSVGEAMAIGKNFREALMKALRSMEKSEFYFTFIEQFEMIEKFDQIQKLNFIANLYEKLITPNPERIISLATALFLGFTIDELFVLTKIDRWFLSNIKQLVDLYKKLKSNVSSIELFKEAKESGFTNYQIARVWNKPITEIEKLSEKTNRKVIYKTVDTCAAEFESFTPYYYSTTGIENESKPSKKRKVIILGGGPNRIGQGIEFDYCCVHAVESLREEGIEAIMVNCNPETVSTDYDTSDKLYFEPITLEDVKNIVDLEKPDGVILSFGGQTPLKLAMSLHKLGIKILGTSPEKIDLAEDRLKFADVLAKLGINCPPFGVANSMVEAKRIVEEIGFPVLIRPSYVLGGRAMEIVYSEDSLETFLKIAADVSPNHPVFIDKFLEDAFEFDVDAICDGKDVFIAGIMQHIEEAGIHSGDSSCVLPPYALSNENLLQLKEMTYSIAKELEVVGLLNIQFAIMQNKIYVLEANPRASRTVPYVSKSIGVPIAKYAVKCILGKKLKEFSFPSFEKNGHISVKAPVFPFNKFPNVQVFLGPEMRSTGEIMGIGKTFGEAFAKAYLAAGINLPLNGKVFISVNQNDKNQKTLKIVKDLTELGFEIIATIGTSKFLENNGIKSQAIVKVFEGRPNIIDFIKNREVHLLIDTPLGETSRRDEYGIGWISIMYKVPLLTTLSASASAVEAIKIMKQKVLEVKCIQDYAH